MASNPQLSITLTDGSTVTVTSPSAAVSSGGATFGTGKQLAQAIIQTGWFVDDFGALHPASAVVSTTIVEN